MSIPYTEPSYQDLWNYFVPPPPPVRPKDYGYLPLIFLGVAIALCGIISMLTSIAEVMRGNRSPSTLTGLLVLVVIGVVLLVWGIVLHQKRPQKANQPPPPILILTDEAYEKWVASKQASLMEEGKQRLGLHEDQIHGNVFVIRSLVFPDSEEAKYYPPNARLFMRKKSGFDGRWHTSINRYLFLYPMKEYLAIFQCDVNALAFTHQLGGLTHFSTPLHYEGTSTYFYDDIVGIDTHVYLSSESKVNGQESAQSSVSYWRQHLPMVNLF